MFDIILSGKDPGPLYMRLYRHFRTLIEDGALQDGVRLPSVRSIQQQLRVSKTTVESAYQMLLAEGYLLSKPKSGYFVVRPGLEPSIPGRRETSPGPDAAPGKNAESPAAFLTEAGPIDFSLLNVAPETFPSKPWRKALTEAFTRCGTALHTYGDPQGEPDLRRQIARYLRSSRGVNCTPEQIVVGTGFSYSLFLLKKLLGGAGAIAFEEESIAQVGGRFTSHGFGIVPSPFAGGREDIGDQGVGPIQAMYVTPSHRPAGQPLTNAMKERLLQWAAVSEAYIIEDDYDGEFRFRGRPAPALQGADRDDVVIYIGTFSKVFSPAFRMNYMILPNRLLANIQSAKPLLSGPSRMDQLAMSIFMEGGHWYRHIKRIRIRYRTKRERMIGLIARHLHEIVQVNDDGAGLHVELLIRSGYDSAALIALALKEGVCVYGPQYASEQAPDDAARIYLGFGGVTEAEMEKGIRILRKAWS